MSGMWPWWRKVDEPENGVYRLICLAGVTLENDGTETPIAVLESLKGYLNIAVPLNKMSGKDGMLLWVDPKEAREDFNEVRSHRPHPGSVNELAKKLWSVHPTDVRASGLTREQWYAKEITDFMNMKRCLEEEE